MSASAAALFTAFPAFFIAEDTAEHPRQIVVEKQNPVQTGGKRSGSPQKQAAQDAVFPLREVHIGASVPWQFTGGTLAEHKAYLQITDLIANRTLCG